MSNICPKGHFSTDPDYCSECGAPISPKRNIDAKPASTTPAGSNADSCPDCMTPRRGGARFCEVCRYDFEKQMSFNGLQSTASAAATTTIPAVDAVIQAAPDLPDPLPASQPVPASTLRLKLKIIVDSGLYTEPDPALPCPLGIPDKEFHLDIDENTLGRQFEGKGIHPEIVVQDPGISRRHLKFIRDSNGNFSVLELGSANGTMLNQTTLEPGVVTALKAGDQFALGMWTRIVVETR